MYFAFYPQNQTTCAGEGAADYYLKNCISVGLMIDILLCTSFTMYGNRQR